MNERQEASIILEAIDELAPTNVAWNNEELWVKAITEGLRRIRVAKSDAKLIFRGEPEGRNTV